VDVNTASAPLLALVSGLNTALAKNIVEYRNTNGPFANRKIIRKVPRLGDKTFEQAAGFLRINDGDNPLDRSAVHPEAYPVVERILARLGRDIGQVMGQPAALKGLSPNEFTDDTFGVPTVRDILAELEKPGRDPRPEFKTAAFQEGIESLADLQPGMILEGVVTNVAAFGAFIDIGVHQDGLVHVSQLANKFVKDPHEIVKPGQVVKVRVMEVDEKRQRISLTMRLDDAPGSGSRSGEAPAETNTGGSRGPRDRRPPEPKRAPARDEPKPGGAIALALERAKLKK
jgi:protein Tex